MKKDKTLETFKIDVGSTSFSCVIKDMPTKNLNVRINPNFIIHISKPRGMRVSEVEAFLMQKQQWLLKSAHSINKTYTRRSSYITLTTVVIFDEEIERHQINDVNKYLEQSLLEYMHERRTYYDNCVKESPSLSVKVMRGKWGLCKVKERSIVLNRKLAHYPKGAVDYVLAHEYAHLLVANHSAAFYKVLQKLCPNYKYWIQYLSEN